MHFYRPIDPQITMEGLIQPRHRQTHVTGQQIMADDFDDSTISTKNTLRPGMTEEEATAIRRPGTKAPSDLWAEHTCAGRFDFDWMEWTTKPHIN
jgi:hypothetical protein